MFRQAILFLRRAGARAAATGIRGHCSIPVKFARAAAVTATAGVTAAVTMTYIMLADEPAFVTDASTGKRFAAKQDPTRFGTPDERLLGTGCRYKYGFVKVYAVGLYLDTVGSKALKTVEDRTASAVLKDDAFFQHVIDEDSHATLVVKMCRAVEAATLASAFEEQLKPRVENKGKESLIAMEQFTNMLVQSLGSHGVSPDTEMQFLRTPGGFLHVVVNNRPAGCVKNSNLAAALFDVYLGKASVTPELRARVADAVAVN
jgi:hypothetical protein